MIPATVIHAMEWINPLVLAAVTGAYLWSYRRSGNRALLFVAFGLGTWALSSLTGEVYLFVANRILSPPSAATAGLAPVSNTVFLVTNLMSLLGALLLLMATWKAVRHEAETGGAGETRQRG